VKQGAVHLGEDGLFHLIAGRGRVRVLYNEGRMMRAVARRAEFRGFIGKGGATIGQHKGNKGTSWISSTEVVAWQRGEEMRVARRRPARRDGAEGGTGGRGRRAEAARRRDSGREAYLSGHGSRRMSVLHDVDDRLLQQPTVSCCRPAASLDPAASLTRSAVNSHG